MKAGYVDGIFVSKDEVQNLANMPSKEVLLSMLLGVMQAPVRGLAVALNRNSDIMPGSCDVQ